MTNPPIIVFEGWTSRIPGTRANRQAKLKKANAVEKSKIKARLMAQATKDRVSRLENPD